MPMKQMLASQMGKDKTQVCYGSLSPSSLDTLQQIGVLPSRAVPIIFLPGILGSKLRLTEANQKDLKKKDATAYDPDDTLGLLKGFGGMNAKERQQIFSPGGCEVNAYDSLPDAKARAGYLKASKVSVDTNSPLLRDDDRGSPKAKSAREKACERGWGEVMFSAYGGILNRMELMMNAMFSAGTLTPEWGEIVDADPRKWGASEALPPLAESGLSQIGEDCLYPVHAVGYNWVRSNVDESKYVARRIKAIMGDYVQKGVRCEKVIVVTHSMGGLLARALCHPKYGNIRHLILGVVHGEQPAMGAAAAYYRMLAGFEYPEHLGSFNPGRKVGEITSDVLGSTGSKVAAILANGGGGLELLPSRDYGNGWLKIVDEGGEVRRQFPEHGDPYEEIYKKEGREAWWGLLREEWINPAKEDEEKSSLEKTRKLLDQAKKFHADISGTYHPVTYAHWGCDLGRPAFLGIVWKVRGLEHPGALPWGKYRRASAADIQNVPPEHWRAHQFHASYENRDMYGRAIPLYLEESRNYGKEWGMFSNEPPRFFEAEMLPPDAPGDQTVPSHSAEHQAQYGKLKGVFRQTGYEHQSSYQDGNAVAATLYSVAQIAKEMKWGSGAAPDGLAGRVARIEKEIQW